MPKEVASNIFQIEVPLPNSPLKAVNCYAIKTPGRNLVVDTGMNRKECRVVMDAALKELDIDLAETDFFITHLHADHMGLVSRLVQPGAKVYFNTIEAEMMIASWKRGGFSHKIVDFARVAGFSDAELEESLAKHPGLRYHAREEVQFTIVEDGDPLEIGDYNFTCVQTPGHSPGHMCLFDADKKLMLCGDHVLNEISPNISAWDDDDSPLTDYLESLGKVRALNIDTALPGHRSILTDLRGRIDELKEHHLIRLNEVRNILDGVRLVPYDIAAKMTWDIKYDTWDDVGVMQKWFATGEAVAHLRHLEVEKLVKSEVENGKLVFSNL